MSRNCNICCFAEIHRCDTTQLPTGYRNAQRGPRIRISKKVTEVSLLSAFKGVEDSAMEAMRDVQNSLGPTTDHDVSRRGPQGGRVREVPLPFGLAPGNYPRVGRLRRCNPDARIRGRFSPVGAASKAPALQTELRRTAFHPLRRSPNSNRLCCDCQRLFWATSAAGLFASICAVTFCNPTVSASICFC